MLWICLTAWAGLFIWYFRMRKKAEDHKLVRRIFCLAATGFIAGTALCLPIGVRKVSGDEKAELQLERGALGSQPTEEKLEVSVGNQKPERITLSVPARAYSAEEIEEALDEIILGENLSFHTVNRNMDLVTEIPGSPVALSWETDRPLLIDSRGLLSDEIPEEGVEVTLKAELELQGETTEYIRKVQVYPPEIKGRDAVLRALKKAVEKEVKSERTKTELITNVSHDLKTPLTAIITYVNLLKQENITEEERNSYIQILDQKSMRLKELIEDLFEVSKAANGTVVLHPEEVDVVSLLKQVHFELSDKIEASGIQFHFDLPNERLAASLDGQKTCRIFENLLVNITKYGMKGTRAYIKAEKDGEYVQVILRNISAEELKISPEELTERFVRGDASRNTEGSGLGLAIARSFTEVQGGTMKIEVEGDLFRVILRWKLKDGSEEPEETIQEGSVQEKLVQEEPEADDPDTSDQ